MTTTTISPQQHDEATAAKFDELAKAEQAVAIASVRLLQLAKAEYHYQGRKRVTDMTVAEAETLVAQAVRDLQRHEGNHFGSGMWVGYEGLVAPHEKATAEKALDGRPEAIEAVQRINAEINELEKDYTGWSRFFLVTSSDGHIHSSMRCSTCRITTRYGWMPQLSGKTEAEAVAQLGPNLCSVCFPTAPVEHQGGKLSTKNVERLLRGEKIETKPAKTYCPGSGQMPVEGTCDIRMAFPRGKCPHCNTTQTVNRGSYSIRKHEAPKAA